MKNLGNIVLKSGGLNLTLLDLLRRLHERDRLLDLLIDAGVDITVTTAARSAGVHVSNTELQQAANRFRQQKGLQTADETTAWLANADTPRWW